MANAIYPKFKEAALQGNVDLATSNVKCVLVNVTGTGTLYTYGAAHEFLDDISAASRVATSGNLGTKTFSDGVFDCADFTFTAATGDICEAIVYYIDTGTASTSRLICYKDLGVTGLPITPNGGDIDVEVDAGGNGVFAL